ncbi:hypothetical protein KQX54_019080 [Cotesia glomerata]|uniref:Uncharacterized protein n=1 Tax=Cotesia glomerata TaxID=32391 RepID=A0AAV7IF38_COTGL|nr:hypothetical protein KQX54_019080 [Cotesia glomerata]
MIRRKTSSSCSEVRSGKIVSFTAGVISTPVSSSYSGSSNSSLPGLEDITEERNKEELEEVGRQFDRDCRGLWTKTEDEIGPGCSQEQDVGSAATLEGKILTVLNKFLTTSPLVNKVKLLMIDLITIWIAVTSPSHGHIE